MDSPTRRRGTEGMPDRLPRVDSPGLPFQDYEAIPIIDEGGGAPPDIFPADLPTSAKRHLTEVEIQEQREVRLRQLRRVVLEGWGQAETEISDGQQSPELPQQVEAPDEIGLP